MPGLGHTNLQEWGHNDGERVGYLAWLPHGIAQNRCAPQCPVVLLVPLQGPLVLLVLRLHTDRVPCLHCSPQARVTSLGMMSVHTFVGCSRFTRMSGRLQEYLQQPAHVPSQLWWCAFTRLPSQARLRGRGKTGAGQAEMHRSEVLQTLKYSTLLRIRAVSSDTY